MYSKLSQSDYYKYDAMLSKNIFFSLQASCICLDTIDYSLLRKVNNAWDVLVEEVQTMQHTAVQIARCDVE